MIRPYTFRICACLAGHEPVELMRSHRGYLQADWDFWTRDLSPEWECWVEHTLDDRHTITSRPHLWQREERRDRLPFTREEKQALRETPEYAFVP